MACHPEQPFTAAQEERIREIMAESRRRRTWSLGIGAPELTQIPDQCAPAPTPKSAEGEPPHA